MEYLIFLGTIFIVWAVLSIIKYQIKIMEHLGIKIEEEDDTGS